MKYERYEQSFPIKSKGPKVCLIHKVSSFDARSFYKQGRSLRDEGYKVIILGSFKHNDYYQGIKLVGIKSHKKRIIRFFLTNLHYFKRAIKEKADIYHFHDLDFIPWAVLLKIFTRSKVIYDIHEAHPEYMLIKTYIPRIFRKTLSIIIYILEHTSIKLFDAIIANDNFIANDFKHKRKIVVFNYPTLDFFKKHDGIDWKERKYDLFYHGTLPRYHFEVMMNIAERLNAENVENKWGIMTKQEDVIQWAKSELRRRLLDNNFTFLEYTDYMNVFGYLITSRMGIIPLPPYKKFMKNIPLKLFEFMGCGIPVVLSDLPPSRQFIEGKNCAISVDPNNIYEYVSAIKLILRNPEKALEMGENGKKLVFENYNWINEGVKLIRLYRELVI